MIDPFGREVTYLRVSVTDRCDFRCRYCMSEDMTFLPKRDLLSLEELDRLCSAFIRLGVKKLRLTGGEPLVRRNIMTLIQGLSRHLDSGDLEELTLTTNGSQLAQHAQELSNCGVKRLNVSVDSLDPNKFKDITRRGSLDQVLKGLQAAKDAGLKIKINTVALKGVNDDQFDDLIKWCGNEGFDLTFIETMPMGEIDDDRTDHYLSLTQMRKNLEETWTLADIPLKTGGPATYVSVGETGGRVGFITPMSHNFCEGCNRVRVTCTGTLYMCLGQNDQADLITPLRQSEGDEFLLQTIEEAISRKPKGHDFVIDRNSRPAVSRHMSVTGG
ncbi:MAG: GTP 3',8-cyclase MoaA [Rhodospirillales bacterium]